MPCPEAVFMKLRPHQKRAETTEYRKLPFSLDSLSFIDPS
jgi:hypothetical protein